MGCEMFIRDIYLTLDCVGPRLLRTVINNGWSEILLVPKFFGRRLFCPQTVWRPDFFVSSFIIGGPRTFWPRDLLGPRLFGPHTFWPLDCLAPRLLRAEIQNRWREKFLAPRFFGPKLFCTQKVCAPEYCCPYSIADGSQHCIPPSQ